MPVQWYDTALTLPADGQTVWVRRIGLEAPYEAIWHTVDLGFTLGNGLVLDWQWASRWTERP